MIKVVVLFSILSVALATKGGSNIVQQRQTDSEGALGPESVPFLAPPPAPAPEPVGAGPDLDALWGPAKPYSFGYDAPGSDGRSSRSESSDGRKVTGSYTMVGADGINRVVHYVADGDGFRASIITNEPGTEKQNPSGVIMETSQPKAEEIARAFGPVAEPGPDSPRQYIGAPIPALPSVASFQRTPDISQGSASPAFDAFTQQVKQTQERFEDQQQQQQSNEDSLGAASLPAPAPAPVALPQAAKSFSQQIVHSIPAPTVQQQVATPVFKPVQQQQQQLFSDYQPVIVQEIPRIAPLPRPTFVVPQQPAFIPQPLPAPQPIPVARPVVVAPAPLPVPTFSFQPAQPISSDSLSSGVKSASESSSFGSVKSASSSAGATKSRFVAPSRVAVRVTAPAPLPALPAPQPTFFVQQPQPISSDSLSSGVKSASSSAGATKSRFVAPSRVAVRVVAPAPLPALPAPLPVPTFSFQPAQPISSGSLSSGVKSASESSSFGSVKSASSSAGATKSRFVAPSRVAVRVVAPAPLPALPAPQPTFFVQQPQPAPAQNSFLSTASQGKTSLASGSAPIKSAAASSSSGKFNGQRILKPFYITSTQAPVRFEQSQQSIFNNQPESSSASRLISQVKDEQQKKDAESQEDQFFRS